MGEGEPGGEDGGQVRAARRAPQQAPAGGQDGGGGGAEDEPGGEQGGPGPGAGARRQAGREEGEDPGRHEGRGEHQGPVAGPVQDAGQHQRRGHRARSVRGEGERDVADGPSEDFADQDDGVDEDHRAAGGDDEIEREEGAQTRGRQDEPDAEGGPGVGTARPLGRCGGGEEDGGDQGGGGQEARRGAGEEQAGRDEDEQGGGQRRAEQVLQVVGEAGEREGAGVVALVGQEVGDRRLEGRGEGGGGGLEQQDQDVDLPDLGDEGQGEGGGGAREVHGDEQRAPGYPVGERADQGGDSDIGDHLDRERRPEDRGGVGAREVVGEEAQRDGGEARTGEGDDLGGEEATVGAVTQHGQHEARPRSAPGVVTTVADMCIVAHMSDAEGSVQSCQGSPVTWWSAWLIASTTRRLRWPSGSVYTTRRPSLRCWTSPPSRSFARC